MAFIRLKKCNDAGEPTGDLLVNSDQIVTISRGAHATELTTADGHGKWVLESPEEITGMINGVKGF